MSERSLLDRLYFKLRHDPDWAGLYAEIGLLIAKGQSHDRLLAAVKAYRDAKESLASVVLDSLGNANVGQLIDAASDELDAAWSVVLEAIEECDEKETS